MNQLALPVNMCILNLFLKIKQFNTFVYTIYHLGLDNLMLEHINKMDTNTVDLINRFLNQLKKPVCLVAHNGNKFDYPILARQLKNLVCNSFV